MRKPFVVFLLGLSLVLGACESTESTDAVSPDRVRAEYDLHYDGNLGATFATVTFYFGGERLKLGEGSVTFDGVPLDEKAGLGTFYEQEFAGVVERGTFEWTTAAGTRYRNTVALPPPVDFPPSVGPIDNDTALSLEWRGQPVGENGAVSLALFRLAVNDTRLAYGLEGAVGATGVLIGADQLEPIPPGPVTLLLERKKTTDLGEGTAAGGVVTARYTPGNIEVGVVD